MLSDTQELVRLVLRRAAGDPRARDVHSERDWQALVFEHATTSPELLARGIVPFCEFRAHWASAKRGQQNPRVDIALISTETLRPIALIELKGRGSIGPSLLVLDHAKLNGLRVDGRDEANDAIVIAVACPVPASPDNEIEVCASIGTQFDNREPRFERLQPIAPLAGPSRDIPMTPEPTKSVEELARLALLQPSWAVFRERTELEPRFQFNEVNWQLRLGHLLRNQWPDALIHYEAPAPGGGRFDLKLERRSGSRHRLLIELKVHGERASSVASTPPRLPSSELSSLLKQGHAQHQAAQRLLQSTYDGRSQWVEKLLATRKDVERCAAALADRTIDAAHVLFHDTCSGALSRGSRGGNPDLDPANCVEVAARHLEAAYSHRALALEAVASLNLRGHGVQLTQFSTYEIHHTRPGRLIECSRSQPQII